MTVSASATSARTTAPAPTTARSPTVTWSLTIAPIPIIACAPIVTEPAMFAPGPMKECSPIDVWCPISAPRLMIVPVPIVVRRPDHDMREHNATGPQVDGGADVGRWVDHGRQLSAPRDERLDQLAPGDRANSHD